MTLSCFIFCQSRLSTVFFFLFLYFFLPLRFKKKSTVCLMLVSIFITGTIEYVQYFQNQGLLFSTFARCANILLVQVTAVFLCSYRDFRALFTGITASAYIRIGNVICVLAWTYLHSGLIAIFLLIVANGVSLAALNRLIWNDYKMEMDMQTNGWGPLCLIPSLFYVIYYLLGEEWPPNAQRTLENSVTMILLLFLMAITYVLIFKMLSKQRSDSELEENNQFLEIYADGLRHQIEAARQAEEKMCMLRHDFRHMSRMILSCLEDGETEKIYEIFNQYEGDAEGTLRMRYCENVVVNGIISSFAAEAKDEGITFDIEVSLPCNFDSINEFELATVVANVLENALNGTKRIADSAKRHIWLQLYPVKSQLILDVSNTFEGSIKISPTTGLPISERGAGHGYGFKSIQAYAHKWDALFQCSIDEGLFHFRMLTKS